MSRFHYDPADRGPNTATIAALLLLAAFLAVLFGAAYWR